MRPKAISGDLSKSEDVLRHVIDSLEANGEFYDYVVMMQATNPVIEASSVREGLALIDSEQSASVQTYCEFNGYFTDDEDVMSRPMTQNRQPRKLETGTFWITRIEDFKREHNRLCQPISYLQLDKLSSLDIDHDEDLLVAEVILEKRLRISEKRYYKERPYQGDYKEYYASNSDPDGKIRDITSEEEMRHRAILAKDEISYVNSLISDKKSTKRILDLGCGTGYMSSQFDDRYEKYGLEIADLITDNVHDHIPNLHIGTLEDNTFEDEFFDVVFSFHVIEHVPEPIPFIKNVARIMKTHGKLVLSTPNFDCAVARRFGDNFRMLHDKTHCSLFSDFSLSEMLRDFGFQVDRIEYPFFDTEYFTMENLKRLFDTQQMSPPFYGNIMTLYATKK
jgi:SAM-dependent methyltransferase